MSEESISSGRFACRSAVLHWNRIALARIARHTTVRHFDRFGSSFQLQRFNLATLGSSSLDPNPF